MNELEIKEQKAKKMMLWVGMISMSMTFAGLTSAYVVSSSRVDWLTQFEMPSAFAVSTVLIFLSSLTFFFAKKYLMSQDIKQTKLFVIITFLLALLFVYFQFKGFGDIISQGYYFTGAESSITTSFLYVLILLHLAHLFAGFLSLIYTFAQSTQGKYNSDGKLGLELCSLYWHFLGLLWVYLFFFLLYIR